MAKWKYGVPVLLALTALAPAFPGGTARAADTDTETATSPAADASVDKAADKPSEIVGGNEDLLLFWEQKELYVETATRTAKPISQVAENMEVITAKDIEDMNAHTVNEVLARVSGVFVEPEVNDFNSPALLHIQGSSPRHVTVLVDGVVWNSLSDAHAEALSIPVGVIERIEIIKGPASSTWGSGLGGVINIITKGVGDFAIPKGMVTGSYGQGNTRDYNGQAAGKAGLARYYLYAGRLASDGLVNHRHSTSDSLYGKIALTPLHNMDLTFSVGYTTPDLGTGNQHADTSVGAVDTSGAIGLSTFHATAAMEYHFAPDWALTAETNTLRLSIGQTTDFTGPNALLHVASGDKFANTTIIDQTFTGRMKLTYTGGNNYAVVGTEVTHGTDEFSRIALNLRGSLQSTAAVYKQAYVYSEMDKWAVFTNDTISLGSFAVTPGIRLDHNTISGTFVSPSVGMTYEVTERSIARLSVARGFTYPPFIMTSGSGVFSLPNPSIRAEQGWSYQAGAETVFGDFVNVKGTVFRHDINNAISDTPDATLRYVNVGKLVRQGYELSAETAPVFNTSLKVANSYVHVDPSTPYTSRDIYSYLIGIKYDDRKAWLAQIFGSYVWWDLPASSGPGNYNTFVWDANVNRKFQLSDNLSVEAFLNLHNIFNSGYTTALSQPNTGRWVEGGLKLRF